MNRLGHVPDSTQEFLILKPTSEAVLAKIGPAARSLLVPVACAFCGEPLTATRGNLEAIGARAAKAGRRPMIVCNTCCTLRSSSTLADPEFDRALDRDNAEQN